MHKFLTLCLSQLLLTSLAISKAQAEPNHSLANVMQDIGRQSNPVEWLKQQQTKLKNDPALTRRLSLELFAESLRTSPQPWPVQAEKVLEALLQIQPQPDIQETLHPSLFTAQTPLRQMLTNAQTLKQQRSLMLYQQQLNHCYRLNILTCQAEMQYQIGQMADLPQEDRLAAFQAGQESAEKAGHLPLTLLNQMSTAIYEDYLDDYGSDILMSVDKSSQENHLTQIQAMAELEWGRYLRDIDSEPEQAQAHFEKSAFLLNSQIHQAQIYFELGKNHQEIGNSARARVSWNQALALFAPDENLALYQQLIEELAMSYLGSNSPELAVPYLETLINLLPTDSEARNLQKIHLAQALYKVDPKQSDRLAKEVNTKLQNQPVSAHFQTWLKLSDYYHRFGQSPSATSILEMMIQNTALAPESRILALQQLNKQNPETASHRALDLMKSSVPKLRNIAVQTLNQNKPTALIPNLLELLKNSDAKIRGNVISVLWHTGKEAVLPQLLELAEDPDSHVQNNLLEALYQGKDWSARHLSNEQLNQMMYKATTENRYKVASIILLTNTGQQQVFRLIQQTDSQLQSELLKALQQHLVTHSNKLSVAETRSLFPLLLSPNPQTTVLARMILVEKGNPNFGPELVNLAQKNPIYSDYALLLLGTWKNVEAIRQLKALAHSNNPETLVAYLSAFAHAPMQTKDISLVSHLLKADNPALIRLNAAGTLLRFNQPQAWNVFATLFIDPASLNTDSAFKAYAWIENWSSPCFPPEAFIHTSVWLAQSQTEYLFQQLRRRFAQPANFNIWNGKTCGAFSELSPQTQRRVKEGLLELYHSKQNELSPLALRYLQTWAPEAL